MSGQWQPGQAEQRGSMRPYYDPLQRILERAERSRMHLHKCAKCEAEVICLTIPCIFRATKLEAEWLCATCKGLRDVVQLTGAEPFEDVG